MYRAGKTYEEEEGDECIQERQPLCPWVEYVLNNLLPKNANRISKEEGELSRSLAGSEENCNYFLLQKL
jgi:hypothetical protein